MTTPNQPPPDAGYVFGGGEWKYGQEYSESAVLEMIRLPTANLGNANEVLQSVLRQAPGGTLNPISEFLPGTDEDDYDTEDVTVDTFVDAFQPKENPFLWIRDTWDAIIKGNSGSGQEGFSLTDLFNSTVGQKREMVDLAAGLGYLIADATANNNSGANFQVAVSDYSGVPSVFTSAYSLGSGTVTNDGDTLEMSNDDLLVMYRYNVSELLTDYFETSIVVPRQSDTYFGSYNNRSLLMVGRANVGWTDLVMARLNGHTLSVGCVSGGLTSGTYTWFGSGGTGAGPTTVTITPGNYMTLRGGTVGGSRVFQFLVNNKVVATFKDVAAVSQVGALYRWTGFGIWNDANDAINRVANVSHFVANDNEPAPILGTYGHMTRIATTHVSFTAGVSVFVDDTFDNLEECSDDLVPNLVDGSFTVGLTGRYLVSARIRSGTSWPDGVELLLYKDGLPYRYFSSDFNRQVNALGGNHKPEGISGFCIAYLEGGDVIQVGKRSANVLTQSNAVRGESTGMETYFTITRL